MKTKTVKIKSLYVNPDNPQKYTDDDIAALVKSIRKSPHTLGAGKIAYCTDYIAKNGASYAGRRVVIAGNKRLLALRQIAADGGLKAPPQSPNPSISQSRQSDNAPAWLVSPHGDAPAAWFFDLTPLGPEARNHWLLESNIGRGEWDAEELLAQFTRDELADHFDAAALDEIVGDAEKDDGEELKKRIKEEDLKPLAQAFFLVSVPVARYGDFSETIQSIRDMGGEVDEQLG